MEPRDERGTAGRLLPEGVRCAVRKISRDIVELARNVLMPNWGVLVGALFLTCCTVTTAPNLYRVTELIPGISTKDDAIAKLGPPTGTLNAENQTILQWGGPQSPVHLAISFGMDNRMIQVVTDAQKLDQLSGVRP